MNTTANQLDMFAPRPARAVATPAARRTDPVTSHQAAEEHTRSGARAHQQRQVAAAVRQWPGCTSFELAKRMGGEEGLHERRYMFGRRLSECVTGGSVKHGPTKRCSITGKSVLTWEPV